MYAVEMAGSVHIWTGVMNGGVNVEARVVDTRLYLSGWKFASKVRSKEHTRLPPMMSPCILTCTRSLTFIMAKCLPSLSFF